MSVVCGEIFGGIKAAKGLSSLPATGAGADGSVSTTPRLTGGVAVPCSLLLAVLIRRHDMGRKAFFIESKLEVFDYATCDKCGLKIKDVQDGKCFWNPNPKAIDRNICRNCSATKIKSTR